MNYDITNISEKPQTFRLSLLLSGHRYAPINDLCSVKRVTYQRRDGPIVEVDLDKEEKKFRKQLSTQPTVFCPDTVIVSPDEKISVYLNYVTVKDMNDSEVFVNTYPTDGVSLTINDSTNGRLRVEASSIHSSDLENILTGIGVRRHQFSLKKYFLPEQGFQFWWTDQSDEFMA